MKALFSQLTNTYGNTDRGRNAANADFDNLARSFGFNWACGDGLRNDKGEFVDFDLELVNDRLVIVPTFKTKIFWDIVEADSKERLEKVASLIPLQPNGHRYQIANVLDDAFWHANYFDITLESIKDLMLKCVVAYA
jgi:hypothetical protein